MNKVKKTKWDTKNCEDCRYWRSPERFEPSEFCPEHEFETPTELDKEIKAQKKDRFWFRLRFILGFLFSIFGIILPLCGMPTQYRKWQAGLICYHHFWFSLLVLITSVALLCFHVYVIIGSEKITNENLKELRTKRAEWIKVPE